MQSYFHKNLVLCTSFLLKQSSLLRSKDVRFQSEMSNSSCSKLSFDKFGDPNKVVQLHEDSNVSSPAAGEVRKNSRSDSLIVLQFF